MKIPDRMKSLNVILAMFCMLCCLGTATGQVGSAKKSSDTVRTVAESFAIYYRFDSTNINPNYLYNDVNINRIKYYLEHSPRVDSIVIYSWASPEGNYRHNVELAEKRGASAKAFLLANSPDSSKLNSEKIILSPLAENWQGLTEIVAANYGRHDREKVLKILKDQTISNDTRKWRLQQLDKGYTWNYMFRHYMPELRAATWVCVWMETVDPFAWIAESAAPLKMDSVLNPVQFIEKPQSMRTILALKTNLLYDAVTALNYSIEIPFAKQFSVVLQQHTPWWETKNNKFCVELLTGGGEFRWWFKQKQIPENAYRKQRDALLGHFLGVYGWTGKGDIQIGRDFGCYQFDFWSAGLSYGYSMPVGKYFNLEFSASAGYAKIPYQHYIPTKDYEILIKDNNKAGTLNYFGLTKAEISLVLPIRIKSKR